MDRSNASSSPSNSSLRASMKEKESSNTPLPRYHTSNRRTENEISLERSSSSASSSSSSSLSSSPSRRSSDNFSEYRPQQTNNTRGAGEAAKLARLLGKQLRKESKIKGELNANTTRNITEDGKVMSSFALQAIRARVEDAVRNLAIKSAELPASNSWQGTLDMPRRTLDSRDGTGLSSAAGRVGHVRLRPNSQRGGLLVGNTRRDSKSGLTPSLSSLGMATEVEAGEFEQRPRKNTARTTVAIDQGISSLLFGKVEESSEIAAVLLEAHEGEAQKVTEGEEGSAATTQASGKELLIEETDLKNNNESFLSGIFLPLASSTRHLLEAYEPAKHHETLFWLDQPQQQLHQQQQSFRVGQQKRSSSIAISSASASVAANDSSRDNSNKASSTLLIPEKNSFVGGTVEGEEEVNERLPTDDGLLARKVEASSSLSAARDPPAAFISASSAHSPLLVDPRKRRRVIEGLSSLAVSKVEVMPSAYESVVTALKPYVPLELVLVKEVDPETEKGELVADPNSVDATLSSPPHEEDTELHSIRTRDRVERALGKWVLVDPIRERRHLVADPQHTATSVATSALADPPSLSSNSSSTPLIKSIQGLSLVTSSTILNKTENKILKPALKGETIGQSGIEGKDVSIVRKQAALMASLNFPFATPFLPDPFRIADGKRVAAGKNNGARTLLDKQQPQKSKSSANLLLLGQNKRSLISGSNDSCMFDGEYATPTPPPDDIRLTQISTVTAPPPTEMEVAIELFRTKELEDLSKHSCSLLAMTKSVLEKVLEHQRRFKTLAEIEKYESTWLIPQLINKLVAGALTGHYYSNNNTGSDYVEERRQRRSTAAAVSNTNRFEEEASSPNPTVVVLSADGERVHCADYSSDNGRRSRGQKEQDTDEEREKSQGGQTTLRTEEEKGKEEGTDESDNSEEEQHLLQELLAHLDTTDTDTTTDKIGRRNRGKGAVKERRVGRRSETTTVPFHHRPPPAPPSSLTKLGYEPPQALFTVADRLKHEEERLRLTNDRLALKKKLLADLQKDLGAVRRVLLAQRWVVNSVVSGADNAGSHQTEEVSDEISEIAMTDVLDKTRRGKKGESFVKGKEQPTAAAAARARRNTHHGGMPLDKQLELSIDEGDDRLLDFCLLRGWSHVTTRSRTIDNDAVGLGSAAASRNFFAKGILANPNNPFNIYKANMAKGATQLLPSGATLKRLAIKTDGNTGNTSDLSVDNPLLTAKTMEKGHHLATPANDVGASASSPPATSKKTILILSPPQAHKTATLNSESARDTQCHTSQAHKTLPQTFNRQKHTALLQTFSSAPPPALTTNLYLVPASSSTPQDPLPSAFGLPSNPNDISEKRRAQLLHRLHAKSSDPAASSAASTLRLPPITRPIERLIDAVTTNKTKGTDPSSVLSSKKVSSMVGCASGNDRSEIKRQMQTEADGRRPTTRTLPLPLLNKAQRLLHRSANNSGATGKSSHSSSELGGGTNNITSKRHTSTANNDEEMYLPITEKSKGTTNVSVAVTTSTNSRTAIELPPRYDTMDPEKLPKIVRKLAGIDRAGNHGDTLSSGEASKQKDVSDHETKSSKHQKEKDDYKAATKKAFHVVSPHKASNQIAVDAPAEATTHAEAQVAMANSILVEEEEVKAFILTLRKRDDDRVIKALALTSARERVKAIVERAQAKNRSSTNAPLPRLLGTLLFPTDEGSSNPTSIPPLRRGISFVSSSTDHVGVGGGSALTTVDSQGQGWFKKRGKRGSKISVSIGDEGGGGGGGDGLLTPHVSDGMLLSLKSHSYNRRLASKASSAASMSFSSLTNYHTNPQQHVHVNNNKSYAGNSESASLGVSTNTNMTMPSSSTKGGGNLGAILEMGGIETINQQHYLSSKAGRHELTKQLYLEAVRVMTEAARKQTKEKEVEEELLDDYLKIREVMKERERQSSSKHETTAQPPSSTRDNTTPSRAKNALIKIKNDENKTFSEMMNGLELHSKGYASLDEIGLRHVLHTVASKLRISHSAITAATAQTPTTEEKEKTNSSSKSTSAVSKTKNASDFSSALVHEITIALERRRRTANQTKFIQAKPLGVVAAEKETEKERRKADRIMRRKALMVPDVQKYVMIPTSSDEDEEGEDVTREESDGIANKNNTSADDSLAIKKPPPPQTKQGHVAHRPEQKKKKRNNTQHFEHQKESGGDQIVGKRGGKADDDGYYGRLVVLPNESSNSTKNNNNPNGTRHPNIDLGASSSSAAAHYSRPKAIVKALEEAPTFYDRQEILLKEIGLNSDKLDKKLDRQQRRFEKLIRESERHQRRIAYERQQRKRREERKEERAKAKARLLELMSGKGKDKEKQMSVKQNDDQRTVEQDSAWKRQQLDVKKTTTQHHHLSNSLSLISSNSDKNPLGSSKKLEEGDDGDEDEDYGSLFATFVESVTCSPARRGSRRTQLQKAVEEMNKQRAEEEELRRRRIEKQKKAEAKARQAHRRRVKDNNTNTSFVADPSSGSVRGKNKRNTKRKANQEAGPSSSDQLMMHHKDVSLSSFLMSGSGNSECWEESDDEYSFSSSSLQTSSQSSTYSSDTLSSVSIGSSAVSSTTSSGEEESDERQEEEEEEE